MVTEEQYGSTELRFRSYIEKEVRGDAEGAQDAADRVLAEGRDVPFEGICCCSERWLAGGLFARGVQAAGNPICELRPRWGRNPHVRRARTRAVDRRLYKSAGARGSFHQGGQG
eukprot:1000583-Rhodomonas_salina.1